jgi:hypothetical protein
MGKKLNAHEVFTGPGLLLLAEVLDHAIVPVIDLEPCGDFISNGLERMDDVVIVKPAGCAPRQYDLARQDRSGFAKRREVPGHLLAKLLHVSRLGSPTKPPGVTKGLEPALKLDFHRDLSFLLAIAITWCSQ